MVATTPLTITAQTKILIGKIERRIKMRQIVKTINAYTFDELNDSAKSNAMMTISDKIADWNSWWEPVMEQQKDFLSQIGLEDAEISFSLAYVQGDYCNIKCENVDVEKLMKFIDPHKEIVDWEAEEITVEFRTDHHNTVTLYASTDDEKYDKLDKALSNWLYDMEQSFYDDYRKEWEYYTSEESIADLCECRKYEFDEDGELL